MTYTVDQSGTTAALAIGTETQLGTNSATNATYILKINAANLALGDVLELRIYSEDIVGGTLTQAWKGTFSNTQINPLKFSVPVPSDIALKCTLKQVAGTGRTFKWSILRM